MIIQVLLSCFPMANPLDSSIHPCTDNLGTRQSVGILLDFNTSRKILDGIIEHPYIPTRPQWLSIQKKEWGSNDEETKTFIKDASNQKFIIEVCGLSKGYGVIVRDRERHPILVISRATVDCVSPFYHELQGVSLGLELAMKYRIIRFCLHCISEDIAEYVTRSWPLIHRCDCPPRNNPKNVSEKLDYCIKCSDYTLDEIGERKNANKILPLIDEIFYNALEFQREGYIGFHLSPIELSKAKAVRHIANSGLDQELILPEIREDEEIAEILYKEVYGHGSEEEVRLQQQQLMLQKQRRELQKLRFY
ncbi:hypothetical protein MKX03_036100 [Papaver bracteatum]|nr:hypothetical protein MKX03_036100 [Papaver bracteatum]